MRITPLTACLLAAWAAATPDARGHALPSAPNAPPAAGAAHNGDHSPAFPDRRPSRAQAGMPPLQLGSFQVGEQALGYQTQSETQRFEVRVQYGRQTGASTGVNWARVIDERWAWGFNALMGPNQFDLVVNGLYSLPSRWHAGLSLGYLQRTDTYSFFSGPAEASANQASHRISLHKAFEAHHLLSDVGVQWYGARVLNTRTAEAVTAEETATQFNWWLDPRRLAPGQLTGFTGSLGMRPWEDGHIKLSLGVEQLRHAYLDGTGTQDRRGTASIDLSQRLGACWRIDGGLTSGVAGQQWRASLGQGVWSLALTRVNSRQGMPGDTTLALSVNLPLGGSAQAACARRGASPAALSSPTNFSRLDRVYRRPTELPTTILAKVDPTARPYLLASFDKAAVGSAIVSVDPNALLVNLADQVLAIATFEINGQPVANLGTSGAPLLSVQNGSLRVDIRRFPNPGPGVTQTVQTILLLPAGQLALVTFNVVGS